MVIDKPRIIQYKNMTLDLNSLSCFVFGRLVPLPPKGYLMLEHLLRNKGRIVSCQRLIDIAWGEDYFDTNNYLVKVHICNLRKRLGPICGKYIQTRVRFGYIIEDDRYDPNL